MSAPPNDLAGLFGRLTDPQDRERYAALISYVSSLPEGDELFRLVELLGLLSLLGERVPAAAAELLAELRAQAKAAGEYHTQMDARLADLPHQIAEGVDLREVAKGMGEAFRQQLEATALHQTAVLLKAATAKINALSGDLSAIVKPAADEYRGLGARIAAETTRLVLSAKKLEEQNGRLMVEQRASRVGLLALAALLAFLLGAMSGIAIEKREKASVPSQVERVDTPVVDLTAKHRGKPVYDRDEH